MHRQILIRLILSCSILLLTIRLNAQSYQLHGVYMYTFTRHIQWPDDLSKGDFDILVYGESPMTAEFKKMADLKKVGTRPIKIYPIKTITEIRKCNILFVPANKSEQLGDILAKVGTNSILVVTEQEGAAAKGSGINFITKNGKLAFELNQAALNKQKLKATSELTRLAIVI